MGTYKFRLQKLLDIRKDREEESKRTFKAAQIEKEETEKKLQNLKEDYNKYKLYNEDESLAMKKLKNMYLNALDDNILSAKQELQEKIINLDEKRQILKERQVERKTVETLKDKQFQAYKKEQELIEQKANDEFALYGFLRTNERR